MAKSAYGLKPRLVFKIGPLDATTIAVDQDHFIVPDTGCKYLVDSVVWTKSVVSTSGTLKLRVITDTSAPGAAASATVVELLSTTLDLSAGIAVNTVSTASLVSGVYLLPGNRIASLDGGTLTGLVGFTAVVTLIPVEAGL
jgi:hypothetical protein